MLKPDGRERRKDINEESGSGGVGVARRRDGVAGAVGFLLLKRRDGGGKCLWDGRVGRVSIGAGGLRANGRLLAQPGGVPMVDYINSVPKYVVSTTLEEPLGWNNSTLIRSNVAEEIANLKRQPGENITTLGSGALVRSLLRGDLLDELRLMVHPLVLGSGKRLFEEGRQALELVDSKTFGTGVLYLTYQPSQS